MRRNYWKCPYGGEALQEEEIEELEHDEFPCVHPGNIDGDCPLKNKKEGQREECQLS